ncbi:hypothetical protein CR513_34338, partial [Mucuna pruriens]
MVVSHHTTLGRPRNPFPPYVWNRRNDMSGSGRIIAMSQSIPKWANLDLLQEKREMAHIRECIAKARVAGRYNAIMILMGTTTNMLTPNWEGRSEFERRLGREHLSWNISMEKWCLEGGTQQP